MSAGSIEMPRYRCHKIVWALKIANVVPRFVEAPAAGGASLIPVDSNYATIEVDDDFVTRHKPRAGGYLVVYEDGYQSFSPAEPFEAGYTRVER